MMEAVIINWLGGNCPVQAEGTFDGVPFYFRARGASVTCDVGEWTWIGPVYEWPDAGWISEDTARAFIDEAYRRWRDRENPHAKANAEYRRRNGLDSERMQALVWAGKLKHAIGDAAQPAYDWLLQYAGELTERISQTRG